MLVAVVCMIVALLLPACGGETPAPAPAPAPSPAPSPAPTPAPKPTPSPTPSPAPSPAPAPAPGPVGTKTLKFSYTMPKGQSVGAGFEWWGTEFEKRTQGRYKVEMYGGKTLISIPAALDSVRAGICEIVMTSTGTFPKDFPLTLVTSLPTMGMPMDTVERQQSAFAAAWELYNKVPEIQAEFKDFKLCWPLLLDPYNLYSKKKEVHYPADFNGMKVGGSGQKMDMVTANGGAKVQQIPPQAYLNLDKGVVDASFNTFAQVRDYQLQEICDYFYDADFGCGEMLLLMNWDTWNGMSAADQKIVMDTFADSSVESSKGALSGIEEGKKLVLDAGKKITEPTPAEMAAWQKAAEPVFKKWAEDAKALGVDATVVANVFAEWKALRQKYIK